MKKIEILSSGKKPVELPGAKYDTAPCAVCFCPGSTCAIECDPNNQAEVTIDLLGEVALASIRNPVQ